MHDTPPTRPRTALHLFGLILYTLFGIGFWRALMDCLSEPPERRGLAFVIAVMFCVSMLLLIAWRFWVSFMSVIRG